MNLISFVDELVKVGAVRCLIKRSADISTAVPDALMNSGNTPPDQNVVPDDASTRLPSKPVASAIQSGSIGGVTMSKTPIDRERFNRPYTERR